MIGIGSKTTDSWLDIGVDYSGKNVWVYPYSGWSPLPWWYMIMIYDDHYDPFDCRFIDDFPKLPTYILFEASHVWLQEGISHNHPNIYIYTIIISLNPSKSY